MMNIWRIAWHTINDGLSVWLIICLVGFSFNVQADNQLDSEALQNELIAEAQRKIHAFEQADIEKVIIPYFLQLKELDSKLVDEEQLCLKENIKVYKKLYSLNPTSLLALTVLLGCEVGGQKKMLEYENSLASVMQALLINNSGASLEEAVRVRDINEAEIILAAADYVIIDNEIVENGKRIAFRYHTIDSESGKFEYHYYDNFEYLKKAFSIYKKGSTDEEVSKLTLAGYFINKVPAAENFLSNIFLQSKKYETIIKRLEKREQLPPISRLNLARSYLYLGENEKLYSLVDAIVVQKDQGDINAAIFIAEMLITLNGLEESGHDIGELLKEVDQRTEVGNGAFQLAKFFYFQEKYSDFNYWLNQSLNQNQDGYYSRAYSLLSSKKDDTALIKLLNEQHEKGNVKASYHLALAYQKGRGVKQDRVMESKLHRIAAEKGNADSMYKLGLNYKDGFGVDADIQKAMDWLKLSTENGNIYAYNEIGNIYYSGLREIETDYAKAMQWFIRGSDAGDSMATANVAYMYLQGKGVAADYDKSIELYKAAAKGGHLSANSTLGDIYQHVFGEKYYQEAEHWYMQGALKGHYESQYELALLYARQLGDEEKAIRWFDKLGSSNNAQAVVWAALNFDDGEKYLNKNLKKALQYYQKAAELGSGLAQVNLGYKYEIGEGVEKDIQKARDLYEQSAAQGNAQGLNNLASFYKHGSGGLEKNLNKAFELYTEASDKGNDYAHNNLGKMYYYGQSVEKDYKKAYELFNQAAEKKFSDSYYYLGSLYYNGDGVEQNYAEARKYFELSANAGDDDSANYLAVIYGNGIGVEKDLKKAISYFELAAKLDPDTKDADYYIANRFFFGSYGIEKNHELAEKFYKKSIKKTNNTSSMNNLAELYRWGHGVKINYAKAIKLYMKAIKIDNKAIAMFNMGELYLEGHGVPKDTKKAFEWMSKSAEHGFLDAYISLSEYYKNGTGVDKNAQKSIEWLQKGTDEEFYLAQYYLAKALLNGDGVEKDVAKAKELMQMSADQGYDKASEALENEFKDL